MEQRPLRTITLLVMMHSKELIDVPIQPYPSCSFVSPNSMVGSLNCSFGIPHPTNILRLIHRYREIYSSSSTVDSANKEIAPFILNQTYNPNYLDLMMDYKILPYEISKLNTLKGRYSKQSVSDVLRTQTNEKFFGLIPGDTTARSRGIYVVGVSHSDLEMGEDHSKLLETFSHFDRPELPPEYNLLQSYNLINVDNLEEIFGYSYQLGEKVENYIGINQCSYFSLTDVLKMCEYLGFEHVNLISMSCRTIPIDVILQESAKLSQIDASEITGYSDFVRRNPNWGGKRRRRRSKSIKYIKKQLKGRTKKILNI
jgi:hypothetical protein